MPKPLPIRLNKEPLIEAVCQLRISAKAPMNTVFPGLLLSQYPEEVSELQQLPAAMLPEPVRAMQPEMAYAPLVRLKFKGVLVMIGERSITVSNPKPYLGWKNFKPLIEEVFTVLLTSKLVNSVERYSVKYTNVLEKDLVPDELKSLAWELTVGELSLEKRATTVQTETVADDLITIISLSGGVTVQAEGRAPVQGALIDVDTICQNKKIEPGEFVSLMPEELDRIRALNKRVFFECLTAEAINALEPEY